MASRRILMELDDIRTNPPTNCSAGPVDADNIYDWQATIIGPPESPYSGGVFLISIHFPLDYPVKPPEVSFKTKVFHPNIDSKGNICLGLLNEDWCPSYTISKILLSIYSQLMEPDPVHPLVPQIGHMYDINRTKYDTAARSWTQKYAMG